jgi:hypothetical protein
VLETALFQAPVERKGLGALERIAQVEEAVFGERLAGGTLIQRIAACEESGIGEVKSGLPIDRIAALEEALGVQG